MFPMDETLLKAAEVEEGGPGVVGRGEVGSGGGEAVETNAMDNSPSSSSDSEAADEGGDELLLESLERSLAEYPANYDAHVQYIQCLRKLAHFEKLSQARKSMNEIYPLSPTMWQEWASDERSSNDSVELFSMIEEIYEKGVLEYLSAPLWCDYVNFVQNHDPSVVQCAPSSVSKMRSLFERAITSVGLHFVEGHMIWNVYSEFEQAIYRTMTDGSNEEKTKQADRIRAIFHRQLSVPSADMQSTLLSYKKWEVELRNISDSGSDQLSLLPDNVCSLYQKALQMRNTRLPYEDQLLKQDVSETKLQTFMNYINYEESCGDPVRVQNLFERAISEFPISSELWLSYTRYIDKTLKVGHVLKSVYSRATRNCSWVGELWIHYMLSLERAHAPDKEISTVFEKSLLCVSSSVDEYINLFLCRVDGLRRKISSTKNVEGLEFNLIRDVFQRASEVLFQLSSDLSHVTKPEVHLQLHTYWTHLEVNLAKDLVAARAVWENLIKKSGSNVDVWKAYIEMEITLGNISQARSIYKRCYTKRFTDTGSEDICNSWLLFERVYGTLDDLDIATVKVMPRLEQLRRFREQQESQNVNSLNAGKDVFLPTCIPQKRKMVNDSLEKHSTKRQKASGVIQGKGSVKGELADVDDATKGKMHFSTSSMYGDGKKAHVKLVEEESKKSPHNKVKKNVYMDQCTAFVSNLSLEANEEDIQKFFNGNNHGGVTAIRLLKDKFTGISRGLAYVDFSDQEHLSSAISKNKQTMHGYRLSVARSDPKRHQKKASTHGGGKARPSILRSTDRRAHQIQLVGKNTFAAPRSLTRSLGLTNKESKPGLKSGEQFKSNEEFRKMLTEK